MAGLIVAETEAQDEIEHEIRPLAAVITPFFFAVTGAQLDLAALADPRLALGAVVLAALGIATKVLAGLIGARGAGRWSALAVGVGMAPRGEVGIVVVTLGLGLGLLTTDLFSAVLVAVVLTTVAAPLMLNLVIPRAAAETEAGAVSSPAPGSGQVPGSGSGRVGLGARAPGSPAGGPIPADSTPAGPSMPAAALVRAGSGLQRDAFPGSSPVGPASWVPRASPVAASSALCPLARRKA